MRSYLAFDSSVDLLPLLFSQMVTGISTNNFDASLTTMGGFRIALTMSAHASAVVVHRLVSLAASPASPFRR